MANCVARCAQKRFPRVHLQLLVSSRCPFWLWSPGCRQQQLHYWLAVTLNHQMIGSRLSKSCADCRCMPFTGFCEKNHLTVGVFSQRLRNFTQRPAGRNRTFLRKLSLFDPAYVLLLHPEGKPKLERLEQRLGCSKRADSGRSGGSHDGQR